VRRLLVALLLTVASQLKDVPDDSILQANRPLRGGRYADACAGNRSPLPSALTFDLRAGAFPGSGHPDVAVHVPPGFDATRRPGVVLYFHGWNGCVATALGDDDSPCSEGGDLRRASSLASQVDDARVNALLVAVELRVDQTSGDPGQLAMPGDLRELLRELFTEHLAEPLGCTLEVGQLDRVAVVAHSGGYQAAASAVRHGQLPQIAEIDLLDALYGADDVFSEWVKDAATNSGQKARFVDLYTSAGGTLERTRALATVARDAAGAYVDRVWDDDSEADLLAEALARPVVFQRTTRGHSDLPRAYLKDLIQSSGFARIEQ
jgi:hypothetical protein